MPSCNATLDTHAGRCEGRKGKLRLRLTEFGILITERNVLFGAIDALVY